MINDIEKCKLDPIIIYSQPVGNFARKILTQLEQKCDGICEHKTEERINLIAGVIEIAYCLGKEDGKQECLCKLKNLFYKNGGL